MSDDLASTPFTVTASQIVWACPWYRVRQDQLRLADGHTAVYNVIEKPHAVYILPILPNGDILLIRTYRHTIQQWSWELPAGNIPPDHTPAEAAMAELLEEVGGESEAWHCMGEFYAGNGISAEKTTLFLAQNVRLTQATPEPMEFIEVHGLSTAVVQTMLATNQINDALTVMALLLHFTTFPTPSP
jgi:ADP-ribose pyrophosphatase